MIISIASGKGGTGKTTVATNLARLLGKRAVYVDADVEAPNGHLFLHPSIVGESESRVPVVRVDFEKCTYCGICREVCRFNAIAVLPKSVMVFDELCHGCGGCLTACPEGAIREIKRPIGLVLRGTAGENEFIGGRLNIGEAMSPPLIRDVRAAVAGRELALIDAPPGTSCPVVAAVYRSDYCVLVTEPTPFGLHDLCLAVEMIHSLGTPFGVVVNRMGIGDDRVHRYCAENRIDLLAEIPDDRRVAAAYARGEMAVDAVPEMRTVLIGLWNAVAERVGQTPVAEGGAQ